MRIVLAATLSSILALGSLWLAIGSNILRDPSSATVRPFSFARVQLLWWVLIIAFCFLYRYGLTFALPGITDTCLALLGIGVGTTGAAQILDTRQRRIAEAHGVRVMQDEKSQGFFTDILSDDNGLSVHRLQALIFNVIYGVAFFTYFVTNDVFDVYGPMQYAVLGMSNAGYLGLKALENNPQNRVNMRAGSPGSDELLDADPAAPAPFAVG